MASSGLCTAGLESPPSRGRGSKLHTHHDVRASCRSPLRGGVDRNQNRGRAAISAAGRPFTGAWIETSLQPPPARRRTCRPFAGAWIETCMSSSLSSSRWSPPSRAWIETRSGSLPPTWSLSPPSQGRGLKRLSNSGECGMGCRPLRGGRGSKLHDRLAGGRLVGRPFTGRGSKLLAHP